MNPSALRLRELATLLEIAAEKNSTIIFPLPIELQRLAGALADRLEGEVGAGPDVVPPTVPLVASPQRATGT